MRCLDDSKSVAARLTLSPPVWPGLEKVSNEVADPECRERAGVAHSVLFNIDKEAKAIMNDPENKARNVEPAAVVTALKASSKTFACRYLSAKRAGKTGLRSTIWLHQSW